MAAERAQAQQVIAWVGWEGNQRKVIARDASDLPVFDVEIRVAIDGELYSDGRSDDEPGPDG